MNPFIIFNETRRYPIQDFTNSLIFADTEDKKELDKCKRMLQQIKEQNAINSVPQNKILHQYLYNTNGHLEIEGAQNEFDFIKTSLRKQ